jgi:type IV secretory pathway VirB3-like protein
MAFRYTLVYSYWSLPLICVMSVHSANCCFLCVNVLVWQVKRHTRQKRHTKFHAIYFAFLDTRRNTKFPTFNLYSLWKQFWFSAVVTKCRNSSHTAVDIAVANVLLYNRRSCLCRNYEDVWGVESQLRSFLGRVVSFMPRPLYLHRTSPSTG